MKKFIVDCGEMVYYAIEVEAETAEEAERIIQEGEYEGEWNPYDGDYFEIYEITESK